MRVLVVGMNPSNQPTLGRRRRNSTLDRLDRWAHALCVERYSFINVVPAAGPVRMSLVQDAAVLDACRGYDKVLALGGFASRVLHKYAVPHHRLPHPSPRNRQLNDPAFEVEALDACSSYLYDGDAA